MFLNLSLRTALFTLFALGATAALAHAELESSTPEDGEMLATAPTEVELVFSESVEVAFSTFKIYRLPEDLAASVSEAAMLEDMAPLDDSDDLGDEHGDDHSDAPSDDHSDDSAGDVASDDHNEDHGSSSDSALAAFVDERLPLEDDSADRVDTEVTSQGSQITIALTDELPAGSYIVMWSAISADEHPIQGYTTFSYAP